MLYWIHEQNFLNLITNIVVHVLGQGICLEARWVGCPILSYRVGTSHMSYVG